MGLTHNFMGSVDERNFLTAVDPSTGKNVYTLFTSSVMEYSQAIAQAFYEGTDNKTVWGPYDAAAIAWIYGNNWSPTSVGPIAATGTPHRGVRPGERETAP